MGDGSLENVKNNGSCPTTNDATANAVDISKIVRKPAIFKVVCCASNFAVLVYIFWFMELCRVEQIENMAVKTATVL